MAQLMTVTGTIDSSQMGFCQMHEHLFTADTPAARANPALRIDREDLSAAELKDYRALGGDTVVDCQPGGAGRDIGALRRISRESGVRIVSVTGFHMPVFYPADHWVFRESAGEMRGRFERELRQGVAADAGEPVFPGAVKAAVGRDGATGRFEVCLRAAAGAAARCGVPLILHTEYGIGAVRAVGVCEEEGLDPAHIAVCHADRQAADFRTHEEIARTGAYLEYDTIARYKYHDDESEIRLIRHMLDAGFGNRLLISLDTTAARLKRYGGEPGLGYILRDFTAMLAESGVGTGEISTITRENPRRIFES
ncbi:MAG: phosphotriesterase [Clostridia bacterium]|nr:phosphotriesterase [Clostridia bacterium]